MDPCSTSKVNLHSLVRSISPDLHISTARIDVSVSPKSRDGRHFQERFPPKFTGCVCSKSGQVGRQGDRSSSEAEATPPPPPCTVHASTLWAGRHLSPSVTSSGPALAGYLTAALSSTRHSLSATRPFLIRDFYIQPSRRLACRNSPSRLKVLTYSEP
ncbi:hypothetical protein N656DRAFT_589212 [Canariomyces notabilis]|uniref:Uncharacterized protein n=1 Tax=Canariomyces notabilis TaxID=2074819 RepID=A0AAN6TH96_9PEZI|nr:hypothetical protein N656DRAFT_589212 [Canariomyces arenarius]